ncbi:MAG: hypothetical protein D8M57_03405 [Candidatus Scalindua sp. AMX11]|nr:MAG: hypothetical protein DWQ00_16585 [Candidatus Scalindua sp.]NOG85911.1 hypothetical protein [Planctomycetota bacterium]RZV96919.1 MAG: hypothetical protein EX341_01670 [Candidatus Scalindua sp. SCAELEC01]TDE66470.1 MAG: hypothetical protein D8M57_03405 [Candidatus Scalindua sp. AMX11]GJQ60914.1 MAG: hypothetical protein SCALA701_37150 [Candidatus Scalindua sp.]
MDTCFQTEEVINIDIGTESNEVLVRNIPDDKLFAIEFIGINGFTTKGIDIYIALDVDTLIYPITVSGSVPFNDPTYSWRIFGSQQVRIYVQPGQKINIHAYRKDINFAARTLVALSGVLFDVEEPVSPSTVAIE